MEKLSLKELQPLILDWAREKNLLFEENAPKQKLKLIEECGELASAILKNDVKLQKDAIGDIFVVLVILNEQLGEKCSFSTDFENNYPIEESITNLIEQNVFNGVVGWPLFDVCRYLNLDLTECVNLAWNEIKDRKGKTVNGTFIKN